ncbi:3'(2'),5'-bisphosphate nucleotidase [Halieaceae bacterium IMCC11814]|uniref:3'(2'),5'-bisphosphate nucleotidase CysQ n=2 Tax=Candidatus Marimicrobium litorale TaxID=2518991 RepID=A0ABT3TC17_9GAMM|nr:3'(2'),5'-bisphosphate nucleotidase [Candidatus Marimicrobium litorale]
MVIKADRQDLRGQVPALLALCQRAGAAICEHYAHPSAGEFESKGDDSPLTRADLASHAILSEGLGAMDESLPLLSEESTPGEIAGRQQWPRYWLVDPLDGTKEFLGRTGEFTINVALIENHCPVLGVLYRPLDDLAYVGIPGQSAKRYHLIEGEGWTDSPLATRPLSDSHELLVLASQRHRDDRLLSCLEWLESSWGPVARGNMGSALKFCVMAEGEGDFYPRFAPCCEWDTAAGHAILEAAGGALLGLDGKPLRYNMGESLYSPPFYAVADAAHPLWHALLDAPFNSH